MNIGSSEVWADNKGELSPKYHAIEPTNVKIFQKKHSSGLLQC